MRRAPAATPRILPEARPRKLTSRSASPSGKVFKIMASVSRAGMKFLARRHPHRASYRPELCKHANMYNYHTRNARAMCARRKAEIDEEFQVYRKLEKAISSCVRQVRVHAFTSVSQAALS